MIESTFINSKAYECSLGSFVNDSAILYYEAPAKEHPMSLALFNGSLPDVWRGFR